MNAASLALGRTQGLVLEDVTDEKLRQAILDKAASASHSGAAGNSDSPAGDREGTDSELKEQADIAAQLVRDAAAVTGAALTGRQDELRGVENQIQFGDKTADFIRRVEDLVLNQGVSFKDAFNIESELDAANARLAEMKSQSDLILGVWNGVGGEVSNILQTLITGTDDWNKVLVDALNSLSKLLFNAALQGLAGGDGVGVFSFLTKGLQGRESGGPVSSNTPYIVGEAGPELFVPNSSGNIIPNGTAMGGGDSTVVNITINNEGNGSRSSSGSDAQEAARLGRLIERSTLAVINREKRPGGALRS